MRRHNFRVYLQHQTHGEEEESRNNRVPDRVYLTQGQQMFGQTNNIPYHIIHQQLINISHILLDSVPKRTK